MKLKFLSLFLFTVFVVFGTISPSRVKAQSANNISANIIPPNPAPHENTNIVLNSYSNNLDSALIVWSIDGKNALSGIGKKSFSLNAPAAGSETIVVATISLPEGNIETRVSIRPSELILLWQANDSYVPPFYRGKALPTPDSEVKVVAMPEIKTSGASGSSLIDSKNMTYSWKKDYTNDQGASGYGKNSFIYINDYLEDLNNISVVAETVDQKYSNQASIDIGMTQPKILFYKNDISVGTIWQNSLTSPHRIQGKEIVEAVPYFISPKEIRNPSLTWSWFINDNIVNILSLKKNLLTIQSENGVSGISRLGLVIENRDKIFQKANKEINIEF